MPIRIECYVVQAARSLYPGALTGQHVESELIMAFASKLRIFKLDEVAKGTSAKTGKAWERHTAQCALITDNGDLEKVGVLDIPPALREKAKPGDYRGVFALTTREFGDRRGLIEAILTDLIPDMAKPGPAPLKA
jgi:hypothetical protein